MSHSSPEHGVPSLSHSDRLVMLRGTGRCPAIENIDQRGESDDSEGERRWSKKRKSIIKSDSEDDFVPKLTRKEENFVRNSLKVKKRTPPRRSAKVGMRSYIPRRKRVESEVMDDISPVPPVQSRIISTPETPIVSGKKTTHFNNNCSDRPHQKLVVEEKDKVIDKTDEENSFISEVGVSKQHSGIAKDVPKNLNHVKLLENVNNNPPSGLGLAVGDICLPPGFGSDKLAKVLIYALEEKVRVSSSHSERELFRKTIHVLLCAGCKDKEKHNKVRCSRCEDRDKRRKREDKKRDQKNASGLAKTTDKEEFTIPLTDIAKKEVEGTKSKQKMSVSGDKKENRLPTNNYNIDLSKKDCKTPLANENPLHGWSNLDPLEGIEDISVIQKYLDRTGGACQDKINRDEVFSDYSEQGEETGLGGEFVSVFTGCLIHSDENNTDLTTTTTECGETAHTETGTNDSSV